MRHMCPLIKLEARILEGFEALAGARQDVSEGARPSQRQIALVHSTAHAAAGS